MRTTNFYYVRISVFCKIFRNVLLFHPSMNIYVYLLLVDSEIRLKEDEVPFLRFLRIFYFYWKYAFIFQRSFSNT